ncbi:MAG: CpaF family protein [Lachnospiraceae bacterium]
MRQVEDDELYELIDQEIERLGEEEYLPLKERFHLRTRLFDSFRRLDILQELVDDPEITEIMVNGKDHIFIEKHGRIEAWDKGFESEEQLEDMIQQIVSRVNRMVNVSRPIADARLEDGSRVHVVLPPIALNGPVLTIRKFPEPITMDRLIQLGSVTAEAAEFLKKLVISGYNLFISGATGSGKSTFLNALSAYIPEQERVITIEDSAELQIQQVPNLVRLETRNANGEGEGAIGIGELIRASLRMNPDRIIVGEVRGKEAFDMLGAFNTGHAGSISTAHSNGPQDMLSRLETMVLMGAELPLPAIRSQIASALDILIHLGKLRDKSRRVLSITEIGGFEHGEITLHPLYQFAERGEDQNGRVEGMLEQVGELEARWKLQAAGYGL